MINLLCFRCLSEGLPYKGIWHWFPPSSSKQNITAIRKWGAVVLCQDGTSHTRFPLLQPQMFILCHNAVGGSLKTGPKTNPQKGMAIMKTFAPKQTQIILLVLLVGLASLACVFVAVTRPDWGPVKSPQRPRLLQRAARLSRKRRIPLPTETVASPANSQDEIVQPDPLDHLLALHSIQFNLGISQPDGGSSSIQDCHGSNRKYGCEVYWHCTGCQ